MDEITVKQLSYDRIIAALELLRFKASGGTGLYRDDVNEVLVVAGLEPIKKPEVNVMEVQNGDNSTS